MPDQLVGMENVVGLLPGRVDQLTCIFHIRREETDGAKREASSEKTYGSGMESRFFMFLSCWKWKDMSVHSTISITSVRKYLHPHTQVLGQSFLCCCSPGLEQTTIHLPPAHHSHPPSHIHCFIPGSKLTFSTNRFHSTLVC